MGYTDSWPECYHLPDSRPSATMRTGEMVRVAFARDDEHAYIEKDLWRLR